MTNPPNQLLELAERCEQATGPDRELDFDIAEVIGLTTKNEFGDTVFVKRGSGFQPGESYTASLDAAMSLVPEGWGVTIWLTPGAELPGSSAVRYLGTGKPRSASAGAATPALALCAAALRAQAANPRRKEG